MLFRKFDQKYLEFAYKANPEGFKQFKEIPKLPITEIAADRVEFTVLAADNASLDEADDKLKIPIGSATMTMGSDYCSKAIHGVLSGLLKEWPSCSPKALTDR